jgi:hypothetical protein
MFVVSEEDAAAIKAAFEEGGEFSAAIELRRRFPGINNNDQAREHARIIAGWQPIPVTPQSHKATKPKIEKRPDGAL